MISRALRRFSLFQLVILALVAALGVASKPVVVPLAHMITGPLMIPGGVLAGGFYMLWIVLGAGLMDRRGGGTLISLVQAILIVSLGLYGTHGIVSFLTYLAPGLAVDLVFWPGGRWRGSSLAFFTAGLMANICGSYLVNLVFFRLPWIPLLLSLSTAALSGGLGGLIAYAVVHKLRQTGLMGLGVSENDKSSVE
ncbi:MAG: ECF transporter S component [Bacillota bacterium]|jgi:hypothetical protein